MESVPKRKSVQYVHASGVCDLCGKLPFRHYCDHPDCKKYICNDCICIHNKLLKNHSKFLQHVVVSKLEINCSKPEHSDIPAYHICVLCKKPLCDVCCDENWDQTHDFTEIQSALAKMKIEMSIDLDKLKGQVQKCQESIASGAELKAKIIEICASFRDDLQTKFRKVFQLLKEQERGILRTLEEDKQQMLKDIQMVMKPVLDQTDASLAVIAEAQGIIDSPSGKDILSEKDLVIQNTMQETKQTIDVLRFNHVGLDSLKSQISRIKIVPEETICDIGHVKQEWKQLPHIPLTAAQSSYIAPHPDGGHVVGASYLVSQPRTSAEAPVAPQELDHYVSTLSIFTYEGKLSFLADIGKTLGNERIRGITVFPTGNVAVLGKSIQIYGPDFKPLSHIQQLPGHEWHSIAVAPSGELLVGDCTNCRIDILTLGVKEDTCKSISCAEVKPRQLYALPADKYVIVQPGHEDIDPIVKIINSDGHVETSLSDISWEYVYCSPDTLGNLYIAALKIENEEAALAGTIKQKLTFARYTTLGRKKEIIFEGEIGETSLGVSVAAKQVALSLRDKIMRFE
ncbi:uncharacterized protein LOC121425511 [Lytechinus variegatus]|uniref:uncharacterized protein LOC121425511 n=1 Tax=Lytechinus variegatus TaxID=7654 RepID=UPI001BB0DDEF|nr:uncharacterized protein LOC121425511 [Lytechinus variegatus]